MIKTLLRKQFLELNAFYFIDRKTGKRRSTGGIVAFSLLFVFVFFSVFMLFMGISDALSFALLPDSMWLYYALMGMMALFVGLLGSVFTTYVSLFKAKDNELLLSMPIAPADILLVRMIGVYAMSLLYTSLAWLPALLRVILCGYATKVIIINGLLINLLLTLLVSALTCFLGWGVAALSTRFTGRSKNLMIVVLSLFFFTIYYFVCFRMQMLLKQLVQNSAEIGVAVKAWIFPIYHLGLASSGSVKSLLVFAAISIALAVICYSIMSKSFIRIVTTNRGVKKVAYKEIESESNSRGKALLKRELSHFVSSPAYMINVGFGLGILPILGVVAVVKSKTLVGAIAMTEEMMPGFSALIPLLVAGAICLTMSMNAISAPSISLEGKNLWILRSAPVEASDVIYAKEKMAVILNSGAAIIGAILLGFALKLTAIQIVYIIILSVMYIMFSAVLGLVMGLKRPNLEWTNETVPIKQSMAVMVVLFGGWVVSVVMVGAGFLLKDVIHPDMYLIVAFAVFAVVWRVMRRWLYTRGCEIFNTL